MEDQLNVIVPFSRPRFFNNVIQNFKSQNYKNKKLIVVENGEGINCFKDIDCIRLSSECHHAHAKNEAISWLKKHNGGWWVTMDDDDYYGPEYLTEISLNLNKANVIGKLSRFFGNEDYTYLLSCQENQLVNTVLGATLVAKAEESCELVPVTHDDLLFTQKMIELGGTVYCTSKHHFIHKRHKNLITSWTASVEMMAQCFIDSGLNVIKFDGCPLDIVNAKSNIENYTNIENDLSIFIQNIDNDDKEFLNFIDLNSNGLNDDTLKQLHNMVSGRRFYGKCSYQSV